mmetsp:Transcript_24345/g.47791  ORF Transcript_24345/g.47791 Transcript_24345/m.47791 type:complete len:206 (-) Transcript_24345:109-726(-)
MRSDFARGSADTSPARRLFEVYGILYQGPSEAGSSGDAGSEEYYATLRTNQADDFKWTRYSGDRLEELDCAPPPHGASVIILKESFNAKSPSCAVSNAVSSGVSIPILCSRNRKLAAKRARETSQETESGPRSDPDPPTPQPVKVRKLRASSDLLRNLSGGVKGATKTKQWNKVLKGLAAKPKVCKKASLAKTHSQAKPGKRMGG